MVLCDVRDKVRGKLSCDVKLKDGVLKCLVQLLFTAIKKGFNVNQEQRLILAQRLLIGKWWTNWRGGTHEGAYGNEVCAVLCR